MNTDPLSAPKAEFTSIVDRISLSDSPVGIDALYTHAVIIAYLQQISSRLDKIEERLGMLPDRENG